MQRFAGSLVVALDIAGDEAGYPLDAHEAAFRHAEEHGLRRTAHAGEAAGPASVWETLRRLRPERIGHGARSIEDPALVDHLVQTGIHLEVCPSSNVQTDLCDTYADHPIERALPPRRLARREHGLPGGHRHRRSSASTRASRRRLAWNDDDLRRCNHAALAASFAPSDVRARALGGLGAPLPV